MFSRFFGILSLGAIVSVLFASAAQAAPGNLDTTFAGSGFSTQLIGGADTFARDVAQAPDGKVVVGGTSTVSPQIIWVIRYNADGSLDSSFSGDGIATVSNPLNYLNGGSIAVQPDGKVLIAGVGTFGGNDDFAIQRLNADGTPDSSFASGNLAHFDVYDSDYLYDIALQADGKVVLAGSASPAAGKEVALVRLTPSGSLDSSFDGDGRAVLAIAGKDAVAKAVAIAPDGSIDVVGRTTTAGVYNFLAARFTSSGTIDPSFGGGGYAISDFLSASEGLEGIAVQPDGKLLGSGRVPGTPNKQGGIVRYNIDGTLDQTFGAGGVVRETIGDGGATECPSLTLLPNGRIVAGCDAFMSNPERVRTILVRHLPSGAPDVTFGVGGATVADGALPNSYVSRIAAQSDGRILVAGGASAATPAPMLVSRFIGGEYAPTAKISSPKSSRVKAKKLTKFAGGAEPAGLVSKVQIAVRRQDARALKKKRQCVWLSSNKAKFKKVRDKTRKCSAQRWLTAKGTAKWSYKLKRRLPKGKYSLYVRVVLAEGTANTSFSKASGTLRSFTVK
ncbi:MAG: delta-60 repeat domain-containing protein [Solirubrobacterales bacterium]